MSLRPSARIEVHRSRYKVAANAEEGQRRGEDNMVEIRKNRRKESFQKKRREGLPNALQFATASASFLFDKKCHKSAAIWRKKAFPYFDDLSMIYGKDRATGVDAQTAEDILEELQTNEQDTEQFSVNNAQEMGTEDLFGINYSPCPSTPHVRTPTASGRPKEGNGRLV